MNRKLTEKGQALILIAFAAIGLFAFSALAIDGSRTYSDKRNAQNTADTAALAAALAYIKEPVTADKWAAAQTAALNRASSNGYENQGTLGALVANTDVVIVERCDDTSASNRSCTGLPTDADPAEYIRVYIVSYIPSTFSKVIGRQVITSGAEAIAKAAGAIPTESEGTPGSGGPLFGGAAMVATKTGNYNQCFLMNGGADLYTHDSGIFINCKGSTALFMNGGAKLNMDTTGQIVGCYGYNGGASFDPIACNQPEQTLDAAYFSTVPTTQTPPTCSGTGNVSGGHANTKMTGNNANVQSGDTATFTPGNFGSITINGSGAVGRFTPGVYCVSGNFNLNGNSSMRDTGGRVIFVLNNQNIVMNGGSVIDFNDLEIYGNNASFLLNGSAIFRADRMRMFSTGNGTFTVNGGSELSSDDAYFYLHRGSIVWNGSSILNLHGPPQGDPFGGLLIHMPWGNTNNTILNGGSQVHLTGTFMVPQSPVTYNGNTQFELHSQIIGYTYIINGGANVDIYFVASENYQPPSDGEPSESGSPTIELTK